MKPAPIELLSPARDAATALAAISHGADAVYIGAPTHGARAAAVNSLDDIAAVVEAAHRFNVKVYVTLNTIIYEHELPAVEQMARELYRIGVDALIVQDMALLRLRLPPIALHASTQCDTRDAAKARFLEQAGFSQIVLARELSIKEIAEIHKAVSVPLEVFIHGALCVCYSGDCRASLAVTGRSANRGECAQICRYAFTLRDGDGRELVADKHLLSLRDLNRSAHIGQLLQAGARSLKIEGRLKDAAYVKNVTAHYRRILDDIIAAEPERYCRPSAGSVELNFTPNPSRSFNRGFTDYFAHGAPGRMASIDTPKAVGQPVAEVVGARGKGIAIKPLQPLHNGDGLGYLDAMGRFRGFRVNRVEGNVIYPAAMGKQASGLRSAISIPKGTILLRNSDKEMDDLLRGESAARYINVRFTLRPLPDGRRIALDAADSRGNEVTTVSDKLELQAAKSPQAETRRRSLEKTGGTIYRVEAVDDRCGDLFIPASALAALRREAVELLDRAQRINYRYDYRRPESAEGRCDERLTFHDNVANSLAASFYRDHGAKDIEPAAEVARPADPTVMTTRHCLRRELGRCLKTPAGRQWKGPLTLHAPGAEFTLDFDCQKCQMRVMKKG